MENKLTVLVNSTDFYAEAWAPFFRLLEIYWPKRSIEVVLNTEKQAPEQVPEGVRIHHNHRPSNKKEWPACLMSALETVKTPYILYLQEDYFLNQPVNEIALLEMIAILDVGNTDVVRCREIGVDGIYTPTPCAGWLEVSRNHGYFVSLQAAIWRKEALKQLIIPGETAWEFERAGTRRARLQLKSVHTPNPDVYPNRDSKAFSYEPTGIVKGQWYRPAVEELFRSHGIKVDFTKRGFFEPTAWQEFIQRQRSRLRRIVMKF